MKSVTSFSAGRRQLKTNILLYPKYLIILIHVTRGLEISGCGKVTQSSSPQKLNIVWKQISSRSFSDWLSKLPCSSWMLRVALIWPLLKNNLQKGYLFILFYFFIKWGDCLNCIQNMLFSVTHIYLFFSWFRLTTHSPHFWWLSFD